MWGRARRCAASARALMDNGVGRCRHGSGAPWRLLVLLSYYVMSLIQTGREESIYSEFNNAAIVGLLGTRIRAASSESGHGPGTNAHCGVQLGISSKIARNDDFRQVLTPPSVSPRLGR